MLFKKYICTLCGYIYDEEKGDPDTDVAPETRFETLPSDWVCPKCGASDNNFNSINEKSKTPLSGK